MSNLGSKKGSALEVLPRRADLSWQRLDRRLENGIPFMWHHHPEMELTLTVNCRGQRFVGDNVSAFEDGDLALVGSDLPHSWVSDERIDPNRPFSAKVIWFDPDWLTRIGQSAVELRSLQTLSQNAQLGLTFSPKVAQIARPMIERLFELQPQEGFTTLLELLRHLSLDSDASSLASFAPNTREGYARIDRVLHHLHTHYTSEIRIDDLAEIAALSPSGLHRMFRRHLQMSVSEYLINLRIGEASARLAASDTPIGLISHDVGYASQANFNKHFARLRFMTPRAYRKSHRRNSH